jgi:hypothetical protein
MTKKIISVLFVLMLITPMMFVFVEKFDGKEFPEECSLTDLPTFTESFETLDTCISENFGLRDRFIYLNALKDYYLFSSSSNLDVVSGKSRWLFLASTYRSPHVPEEQLDQLAQKLKYTQTNLEQRGAKFIFVLVPDKKSIYPEHTLKRFSYFDTINYETLMISLDIYDVNHTDLQSIFEAERTRQDQTLLYSKQDSHWNRHASYIAYREILRKLDLKTPETTETAEYQREGDLARMIGIGGEETTLEPVIKNPNTKSFTQAYVFYDSFGLGLLPFFEKDFMRIGSSHIKETLDGWNKLLREAKDSQLVILQIAERDIPFLVENF